MNVRIVSIIVAVSVAAVVSLAGCSKSESESSSASSATSAPHGAPATWVLVAMPEGAVDVAAAKTTAKEGDHVVLRGRIGGRKDPMSKDAAVFVVMDPAVPSCADGMPDHCDTPWDYCCETPDTIAENNATVQVVDASGKAIPAGIATGGFSPLDTVVIVGTVGPRPNDTVLTIKATGLYKVGG